MIIQLYQEVWAFSKKHLGAWMRLVMPYIFLLFVVYTLSGEYLENVWTELGLDTSEQAFPTDEETAENLAAHWEALDAYIKQVWMVSIVLAILSAAITPLFIGPFIKYMINLQENKNAAAAISMQEWRRLFVLSLAYTFIVFAGLLLLIVPGVIFMIRFAFADICLLRQQLSVRGAMYRSWKKTDGHFSTLFFGGAGLSVIFIIAGMPFTPDADSDGWVGKLILGFISVVISTCGLMVIKVFLYRVFALSPTRRGKVGESETRLK